MQSIKSDYLNNEKPRHMQKTYSSTIFTAQSGLR